MNKRVIYKEGSEKREIVIPIPENLIPVNDRIYAVAVKVSNAKQRSGLILPTIMQQGQKANQQVERLRFFVAIFDKKVNDYLSSNIDEGDEIVPFIPSEAVLVNTPRTTYYDDPNFQEYFVFHYSEIAHICKTEEI